MGYGRIRQLGMSGTQRDSKHAPRSSQSTALLVDQHQLPSVRSDHVECRNRGVVNHLSLILTFSVLLTLGVAYAGTLNEPINMSLSSSQDSKIKFIRWLDQNQDGAVQDKELTEAISSQFDRQLGQVAKNESMSHSKRYQLMKEITRQRKEDLRCAQLTLNELPTPARVPLHQMMNLMRQLDGRCRLVLFDRLTRNGRTTGSHEGSSLPEAPRQQVGLMRSLLKRLFGIGDTHGDANSTSTVSTGSSSLLMKPQFVREVQDNPTSLEVTWLSPVSTAYHQIKSAEKGKVTVAALQRFFDSKRQALVDDAMSNLMHADKQFKWHLKCLKEWGGQKMHVQLTLSDLEDLERWIMHECSATSKASN